MVVRDVSDERNTEKGQRSRIDHARHGWSRRGFLAVSTATALGTGNVSGRSSSESHATISIEADEDATRLARALAHGLEDERNDVATARRQLPTGQNTDASHDDESNVQILARFDGVEAIEAAEDDGGQGGVTTRFDLLLDVAQFVPSRKQWYAGRIDGRGDAITSRPVERWVEYDGVFGQEDRSTVSHVLTKLDEIRPRRVPGSATPVVFGTRAFQYSSGFGGESYYAIEGERLEPSRLTDGGLDDDGVPLVRTARLSMDDATARRFGRTVERIINPYAAKPTVGR